MIGTHCQSNRNVSGRRAGLDRRIVSAPDYNGPERRSHRDRRIGIEKRKHKRFKAKEGSFAALRSDHKQLGQIKNISIGGLAFEYIQDGAGSNGSDRMDIFLAAEEFYLTEVLVRTVSDFEVVNHNPFSSLPLRQRNIQFENMMPLQIFQLYYFLQHHTIGDA